MPAPAGAAGPLASLRLIISGADDLRTPTANARAVAATQMTAAEIARLLALADRGEARIGEAPLAGGDIAVLVQTNAQAGKMREALLGLGVASVQLSEAGVFASPEAAEVERVLDAARGLLARREPVHG